MIPAPKQEVLQYLDQLDERNIIRVLLYVKSLTSQKKSPYGKFKTAEEYAHAKELWNEFEQIKREISLNCEPLPEDFDYKKDVREARWRKYEGIN